MWSHLLPLPGSFGGSRDRQEPGTAGRELALGMQRVHWGWLEVTAQRRCLMQERTGLYSLEE